MQKRKSSSKKVPKAMVTYTWRATIQSTDGQIMSGKRLRMSCHLCQAQMRSTSSAQNVSILQNPCPLHSAKQQ